MDPRQPDGIVRRMSRAIARRIAPQARGRLTPRTLAALERHGFHVHRVGQAAYVHRGGIHLLFGVWPRRSTPPAWADRLGRPSDGYLRRLERVAAEQSWRRMARDLVGRFSHRLPWWNWPRPAAYSFEPSRPGWHDQELADALEHNSRIRQERGIEPDPWYGESSPTLARAMDGDR